MAQAIIDCADAGSAPRRLALGSGAFIRLRAALTNRLAALEMQRDIAVSTEADA
jgi:hypothetical protein